MYTQGLGAADPNSPGNSVTTNFPAAGREGDVLSAAADRIALFRGRSPRLAVRDNNS
jgi:hypothetical protein